MQNLVDLRCAGPSAAAASRQVLGGADRTLARARRDGRGPGRGRWAPSPRLGAGRAASERLRGPLGAPYKGLKNEWVVTPDLLTTEYSSRRL